MMTCVRAADEQSDSSCIYFPNGCFVNLSYLCEDTVASLVALLEISVRHACITYPFNLVLLMILHETKNES